MSAAGPGGGEPARPPVRRASPRDRDGVLASVVAAFADDPAWNFILAGEHDTLAAHFAAALFDVRVAAETVWVTDDLASTAMWDAPGAHGRVSALAREAWARYRELAGERAWARLKLYNEAVAAVSPAEPHWYLGVLATHPAHRAAGLATAVITPVVQQADRAGLACCLETSTEANRRFYARRGFTQATPVALAGGPPTWFLRRPPQNPAGAAGAPVNPRQPPRG